jgi:hypothetical protein
MQKLAPKVAGELLAYCTKCRMDLIHVVVSMEGEAIAKTQCKSCGGVHMYRAPKSGETRAHSKKVQSRRKGSAGKAGAGNRAVKDSNKWKDLVNARAGETPRIYRMHEAFCEDELISHTVFGKGVVIGVRTPEKIEVHFEEGIKLLAQGK